MVGSTDNRGNLITLALAEPYPNTSLQERPRNEFYTLFIACLALIVKLLFRH